MYIYIHVYIFQHIFIRLAGCLSSRCWIHDRTTPTVTPRKARGNPYWRFPPGSCRNFPVRAQLQPRTSWAFSRTWASSCSNHYQGSTKLRCYRLFLQLVHPWGISTTFWPSRRSACVPTNFDHPHPTSVLIQHTIYVDLSYTHFYKKKDATHSTRRRERARARARARASASARASARARSRDVLLSCNNK